MGIEYELAREDWAAFGEHCARTAPGFQKTIHVGVIAGIVFFLACFGALSLQTGAPYWMFAGMIGAVIWGLLWPRYVVSHARGHMSRRDSPCMHGRHLLEAMPEGLHAKCDISESTLKWPGIVMIAETSEHVFVMLSDVQGYVVPKRRITQGNVSDFLQEIDRYRKQRA